YVAVDEIPKVKSGRGLVLISTSKGIMTGQEAVKNRLGGELLVKVW
ncbi:30S ribosomal protein S8, partial [Candidatus Saccharibacteria bacterium]|nr:30S ribosomal protein S8 [Candidatus Saccharibacteria bacterium]